MNLKSLFTRRSQIESTLSELKAKRIECESALVLVSKLEAELPAHLEAFRAESVDIVFSRFDTTDFHGSGPLRAGLNYHESAERLLKDLPEIKRHWQAKQAKLAA